MRARFHLLRSYIGGEGIILIVEILVLEVVQKPVIVKIIFLILFLGWLKLLRLRPSIKDGRILDIHLPHKLFPKVAFNVQVQIRLLRPRTFNFFKILLLFFLVIILLCGEELRLDVLVLVEAAVEEFRLLVYHLIFVLGERLERERLGLL